MKIKFNISLLMMLITSLITFLPFETFALSDSERLILFSGKPTLNFSIPSVGATLAPVGDSRIQNSVSYGPSGGTLTSTVALSQGYAGWFDMASNHIYPMQDSYGVGSSSSLGLFSRVLGNLAPYTGSNPSNYDGIESQSTFPVVSATGAETIAPYTGSAGISGFGTTTWFAGYRTPGSLQTPGWVKVTFGAAGSVSSTCGTGSGYTPYYITDSNSDTIPSYCISDTYSATSAYPPGGSNYGNRTETSGGAWANFTVTQPSSGTRAQAGDTFQIATFGPSNRAITMVPRVTDMSWNIGGSHSYSPLNGPQQAVLIVDSVNDTVGAFGSPAGGSGYGQCPGPIYSTKYPSMLVSTPCLTMVNIAAILDAYLAAGKLVFLADEVPGGPKTAQMEQHAVTASCSGTITASNVPLYKDGSQWAGTNGLGATVIPVAGLIGTVGTSTYIYTYTTGAPAVGYYSVNPTTGVYTINTSDPLCTSGGYAYLNYTYSPVTSGSTRAIIHAWLTSNKADFVFGGIDYYFPGALYNRPNVIPLYTWEAIIDANPTNYSGPYDTCAVNNCYSLSGAFDSLALHPTIYGANLFASAVRKAMATNPKLLGLPSNTQAPIYNNIVCGKSNGAALTYSCIMPASMLQTGHPTVTLAWLNNTVTESGGTFTGTGLAGGSTVNYSTGAVTINFTAAPPVNTNIFLLSDPTNLNWNNPMLENVAGSNAVCSGILGLTTFPAGWQCYGTPTLTGVTTTLSYGTNPYTGVPALKITLSGVAPSGGGGFSIYNPYLQTSAGNIYRMGLNTVIGPNNGHLMGVRDVLVKSQGWPTVANDVMMRDNTSIPAFYTINAVSGTTSGYQFAIQSAYAGTNALNGWTYNDQILSIPGQSLGVSLELLTLPIDWKNNNGSTGGNQFIEVDWNQGPVSATIYVSQAHYRIRK
jgi:hypothetical protein